MENAATKVPQDAGVAIAKSSQTRVMYINDALMNVDNAVQQLESMADHLLGSPQKQPEAPQVAADCSLCEMLDSVDPRCQSLRHRILEVTERLKGSFA